MSSAEPATRERILEAACTLLAQGSAEAASMARIAKAAGLSRQAVYPHFASRAELLIAAARHVDQARDVDARLAASRAAETGEAR
ncbi:MAG: helix-turn-helix domain-containing protein, partial [Pseudomonadota bacterium]